MAESLSSRLTPAHYREIPEIPLTTGDPARMAVIEDRDEDGAVVEYIFHRNYPFDVTTPDGMRKTAGVGALVAIGTLPGVRFGPRVETGRHNDSLDVVPPSSEVGVGLYLARSKAPVNLLMMEVLRGRSAEQTIRLLRSHLSTPEGTEEMKRLAIESVRLLPRVTP